MEIEAANRILKDLIDKTIIDEERVSYFNDEFNFSKKEFGEFCNGIFNPDMALFEISYYGEHNCEFNGIKFKIGLYVGQGSSFSLEIINEAK